MKIKTAELTGAALDWAVAQCEGLKSKVEEGIVWLLDTRGHISRNFNPSSNWNWAGPIMDRESIGYLDWRADRGYVQASKPWVQFVKRGPTPPTAAMRCYVASRLGDEVEVPDELLEDYQEHQTAAAPERPRQS